MESTIYCIDILNSAFMPFKTLKFDNMDDCIKAYNKLEPIYYPAFLNRYKKTTF